MATITATIGDCSLELETNPRLFSPRKPDPGTMAMLSMVALEEGDRVLDLGCGYGLVGIYAALLIGADNVVLVDVDPLAVELAGRNTTRNGLTATKVYQSDGFTNLQESGFTKILCNPPYHQDFSTPKHFIEKGFNRLRVGGTMWLVTKRERWYRNKLTSVFGGVRVNDTGSYFVFEAEKRTHHYGDARSGKA